MDLTDKNILYDPVGSDSEEIERNIYTLGLSGEISLGMSDDIGKNDRFPYQITNTDDSSKDGQHWVLFLKKKNNYEFFDSFGQSALNPNAYYDISPYVMMHKSIYENLETYFDEGFAFQSVDTSVCGIYCLVRIMCDKLHLDMVKDLHFTLIKNTNRSNPLTLPQSDDHVDNVREEENDRRLIMYMKFFLSKGYWKLYSRNFLRHMITTVDRAFE
ncbi:hypothetical protein GQ473_06795 [archaeon]|nr:hypothetical protein [archaeon]